MKKPLRLKFVKTVKVRPTKPFVFDPTFHKPDHFTSGDNLWEPGVRWQTWNWNGIPLGLKFVNKGTISNPLIDIGVFANKNLPKSFVDSLIKEIKYLYNLELDLADFYKTFKNDRVLGPIIKRWRGMRPGQPSSLYEYLIIGFVLQNATVRRSMQMFQALLEKYGTPLEYDGKRLWCFWTAGELHKQRVTEAQLESLKVGYRAKFIKKVDERFARGKIDEQLLRGQSRDIQVDKLLSIYGVGPATIWYLLFDIFHHWDLFNHISPWEQKIYSKLFFNRDPENPISTEKLLKHFEKYGDYKQLAVHYIWEDLWWKRKNEHIPWLEKLIRV